MDRSCFWVLSRLSLRIGIVVVCVGTEAIGAGKLEKIKYEEEAVRLIREEIAAFKEAGGVLPEFPKTALPSSLDSFPLSFKEAAQKAQSLVVPFVNLREGLEPTRGYQSNEERFYAAVDALVNKSRLVRAEEFLDYYWISHGCATGDDVLTRPQSIYIWLALLREKRYAEAVGAALLIQEPLLYSPAELRAVQREFLKRCGFNVPELGLGMVLLAPGNGYFGAVASEGWTFLANGAGRREAGWLQLLASDRNFDYSSVQLLGELAAARGGNGEWQLLQVTTPVPAQLRKEIFQFLEEKSGAFRFGVTKELLSKINRSDEAKPLLRKLRRHPSGEISAKAVEALRAMGEAVDAPKSKQVRFRLLNNGAPLKRVQVDVTFNNRFLEEKVQTDDEGEIVLDRGFFLDPQTPVSEMTFSSLYSQTTEEPLFSITIPAPRGNEALNERQTVEIGTRELELRFLPAPFLRSGDRERVWVEISISSLTGRGSSVNRKVVLRDAERFPAIQAGRIEITVSGPKLANRTWKVDEAMENAIEIPLERGADLSYSVSPAENWEYSQRNLLKRNGEVFKPSLDYSGRGEGLYYFRGLPKGDYSLRILLTRRLRNGKPGLKDGVEYKTPERTFRVEDDSPETIDLGEFMSGATVRAIDQGKL